MVTNKYMNPFKIIWLKASIAALIPSLAALNGAFSLYVNTGLPTHWKIFLVVTLTATAIAGWSALGSFVSTTFADHKAQQQSGLDATPPPPITAAQVAAAPKSVNVPVVQSTPEPPSQPKTN